MASVALVYHGEVLAGTNREIYARLSTGLAELGFQVEIFKRSQEDASPAGTEMETAHVNPVKSPSLPDIMNNLLPFPSFLTETYLFALECSECVKGFDIVHTFHPIVSRVISRNRRNIPVIYHSLMGDASYAAKGIRETVTYRSFLVPLEAMGAKASRKTICISESLRNSFISITGEDPSKFVTLPFGVDLEVFSPSKRNPEVRAKEFGIGSEFALLFVGRVEYLKGVDILIDALGRLQGSASKEFVLLVVGPAGSWNKSAGYIASLRRRIRELGMEGQVRFTGAMPHDRLSLLMANCDALVLPSRLEGRPNVILEAMASGIACVASRVGGCEEAIGHEGSGLTFEDENKEELGRILSRLINNPEEARRMGRIGRETAMQKYNWKKISLRLAALYEEVLGMAVPAQSA